MLFYFLIDADLLLHLEIYFLLVHGLVIYTTGSATFRAGPVVDSGLVTLIAGFVAGAAAALAGDASGTGAAVTFDAAGALAIGTVLIVSAALGTHVAALSSANVAPVALVAITQAAVTPATATAEGAVVGYMTCTFAAGAYPVGGYGAGEQHKACHRAEDG